MAVIKKDGNFMGLPMNIARGNPIPLDKSEIWYSYSEMENYAKNNPISYVGQILCLVNEEAEKAEAYIILNKKGELQKIGSDNEISFQISGDQQSITLKDNIIALQNWGIQYYKFVPGTDNEVSHYELQIIDENNPWPAGLEPKVSIENGQPVLAWYEPNLSSIEGVNSQISSIQTAVQDLQKNTYTKVEIDKKIASAGHLKRVILQSIQDIDINAEDADLFVYMIPSSSSDNNDKYDEYMVIILKDDDEIETRFIEKIGSWEVDLAQYVTYSQLSKELENKVEIQDGFSLIPDDQLLKLQGIEPQAQKNFISSVNADQFKVSNGQLSLNQILISDIYELEKILEGKVDIEEGKGLSSNDFTNEHLEILQNTITNFQTINQKIASIESVLNDKVDEATQTVVPGLIKQVQDNILQVDLLQAQVAQNIIDIQLLKNGGSNNLDNFITKQIFESTVGNIEELQKEAKTLHQHIQEIENAITWSEL